MIIIILFAIEKIEERKVAGADRGIFGGCAPSQAEKLRNFQIQFVWSGV